MKSPAAIRRTFVVVGLATLMSACAAKRSDIPYSPAAFNTPPDADLEVTSEYRLGPSDLVSVTVLRVPDLTREYRVDSGGNIMVPLAGQVPVNGLTLTEAAAVLRERLNDSYYVNPDVTVGLVEANSRRITVDGSVQQPGIYPIPGRVTLMQAVAMAHGTAQDANLRRVVVFRQIGGQQMAAAFDLREIRDAKMEDPTIYPSDIIVVDGNQTKQTLRDILMTVPVLALFRPLVY